MTSAKRMVQIASTVKLAVSGRKKGTARVRSLLCTKRLEQEGVIRGGSLAQ